MQLECADEVELLGVNDQTRFQEKLRQRGGSGTKRSQPGKLTLSKVLLDLRANTSPGCRVF
jgi:hypothetical protein